MNYHMTLTPSLRFAAKQYRTDKHEGTQQNDLWCLTIIIRHCQSADWSRVKDILGFLFCSVKES